MMFKDIYMSLDLQFWKLIMCEINVLWKKNAVEVNYFGGKRLLQN